MTEIILDLLGFAFSLWNSMIDFALELLAQTPETFSDGKPWEFIEKMEPVFVAIGCNLTSILFLAGWINESLSFKDELRPENMLRMFLRLSVTEALVTYSMPIMRALSYGMGLFIAFVGANGNCQLEITKEQEEIINEAGFVSGIAIMIILILLFFLILGCSFFIIYAMFFRTLRLLVMIPYGAVAFSTYAGSGRITDVMVSYIKSMAAILLEGVSIVFSIQISNLFMMYGLQGRITDMMDSVWIFHSSGAQVLVQLLLDACTVIMTVGVVKSARDWTGRMLGL